MGVPSQGVVTSSCRFASVRRALDVERRLFARDVAAEAAGWRAVAVAGEAGRRRMDDPAGTSSGRGTFADVQRGTRLALPPPLNPATLRAGEHARGAGSTLRSLASPGSGSCRIFRERLGRLRPALRPVRVESRATGRHTRRSWKVSCEDVVNCASMLDGPLADEHRVVLAVDAEREGYRRSSSLRARWRERRPRGRVEIDVARDPARRPSTPCSSNAAR